MAAGGVARRRRVWGAECGLGNRCGGGHHRAGHSHFRCAFPCLRGDTPTAFAASGQADVQNPPILYP
eukprot:3721392-Lingulodinium_polyedra.AAC.1